MQIGTPFSVESIDTHYCLPKNTPAMQILPDATGKLRMGTLIRLPEGAEVEVCGEGFNEATTKVSWNGSNYYVFREDLKPSAELVAAYAG